MLPVCTSNFLSLWERIEVRASESETVFVLSEKPRIRG